MDQYHVPPEKDLVREAKYLAEVRLSVREYSASEMKSYLKRKGHDVQAAEKAVGELVEEGRLSDNRYARAITRHQSMRDKGPMQILGKLKSKGVSINLKEVKSIYGDVSDHSEADQIVRILERRYSRANEDEGIARKAYQGLLRRGFSSDAIRVSLKKFKDPEAD